MNLIPKAVNNIVRDARKRRLFGIAFSCVAVCVAACVAMLMSMPGSALTAKVASSEAVAELPEPQDGVAEVTDDGTEGAGEDASVAEEAEEADPQEDAAGDESASDDESASELKVMAEDESPSAEDEDAQGDRSVSVEDSPIYLAPMLTAVTMRDDDGNPVEGAWPIQPNVPYTLRFEFAEVSGDDTRQFADDETPMVYALPSVVRLSDESRTVTFDISLGDEGVVKGNTATYDPDTNAITVVWNTSDSHFSTMRSMGNVQFYVELKALFSENLDEISFSDTVTAHTKRYHRADLLKEGTYDASTGRISYTLTVTSVGESTNVVVRDPVQGALLKYACDATWTSTMNREDAQSIVAVSSDDGGFSLTFPSMSDGEVITIAYSAEVDFENDSSGNWELYNNPYSGQHSRVAKEAAVTNVATLSADDDADKQAECSFTDIYKESMEKTGTYVDTDDPNVKRVHWTVLINKEATVCYAGKTVTDRIVNGASITNYDTDTPMKITVCDRNGNLVRRDEVAWSSTNAGLTYSNATNDTTWSYVIPSDDKNYQYTFEYDTLVDVAGLGAGPTITNSVTVNGHSRYGAAWVPAGEAKFALTKDVNTDASDEKIVNGQYVEWKITVTVPAGGSTEAYLDDEFPRVTYNGQLIYDSLDTSDKSFGDGKGYVIEGLVDGESCTTELLDKKYSWGIAKLIRFTFCHQDQADEQSQPGFKGTGQARQVVIILRTANNQTWLDAFPDYGTTSGSAVHKNLAYLYVNGNDEPLKSSAEARPQHCRPIKSGGYHGSAIVDGVEYPIYHYQVIFQNVNEILKAQPDSEKVQREWTDGTTVARKWFEAKDQFDTEVFRYLDANDQTDLSIMEAAGINTALASRLLRLGGTTGSDVAWKPAVWDESTSTFRFYEWEQVPRPNGTAVVSNYVCNYYLIVKDADALAKLQARSQGEDGYQTVELENTISYLYNGASSTAEVSYDYKPVNKDLVSYDSDTRKAHYRIVLNELKETMNNGRPMTMTDEYANMSVDYQTVTVTTDPANRADEVVWNFASNTGTFEIPDATRVVIEYDATVLGAEGDEVIFTNTATLNSTYSDGTSDHKILASAGGGTGTNYRIRLSKFEAGNQAKGLKGAVFQLYAALDDTQVGSPMTFSKGGTSEHASSFREGVVSTEHAAGDEVYFVTGSDGYVTVQLDENTDGISLQKGVRYFLKEVKAPEGYQLSNVYWSFKIADQANYTDPAWTFLNNDILTVANEPIPTVPLKVVKVDQAGMPLAGATFSGDGIDGSVTTTVEGTGADAEALIWQMDEAQPGTYTIREVSAPSGYYPLEGDIVITVSEGEAGDVEVSVTVAGVESSFARAEWVDIDHPELGWVVKIANDTGYELPSTGGIGTGPLYLLGATLLTAVGAVLVLRRS